MENLEKKSEEQPKSSEKQDRFYAIVDKLMQMRKKITDSQPAWYRAINYGDLTGIL